VGDAKKYFATNSQKMLEKWIDHSKLCIETFSRISECPFLQSNKQQITSNISRKKSENSGKSKISPTTGKRIDFSLFDSLPHVTIVISEKGIIQYANPAAVDFTGYTISEMLESNVNMLMPENIAVNHDQYISRYVKTGKATIIGVKTSVPLKQAKGTQSPCYLTVTEHLAPNSARYFIGTLVEDNSAKYEEPSNIERRIFSNYEKSSQAAFGIDGAGKIQNVNEGAHKLTGYPENLLIGNKIKDLVSSVVPLQDLFFKSYTDSDKHKLPVILLQPKSGEKFPVQIKVTEHIGENNLAFFVAVFSPVQNIEDDPLETIIEKHRVVFSCLEVPVIVCTADGIVRLCNKPAEKSFGYAEKYLAGKNVSVMMGKAHAMHHDEYIEKYLSTGKSKIIGKGRLVQVKCVDGSTKSCHLTVTCKHHLKKEYTIFVGVMAVLGGEDFVL